MDNGLKFTEIETDDMDFLSKVARRGLLKKVSLLKVTYSHAIGVIVGFHEFQLNQILEHIEKYNCRIN